MNEQTLDVTWGRTATIWWGYLWRSLLWSTLLGAVLGGIGGVVFAIMGRKDLSGTVGSILGQLGSIPVSFVILRVILKKEFKEFRTGLLPK